MVKVSIIILNWNGGAATCIEAVKSALSQDYKNLEIVFVDNASSDDSFEAVKVAFPDLVYVQTGENIGCPAGRNVGASHAKGDLLCFLENDGVWADTDVVSKAVDLLSNHEDIGALYTKVKGYKSGVTDKPLDSYPDNEESEGVYLSSSFRGGASFIRTDVFRRLGGFPNDYFRQGEERYLSLLIYEDKYKVAYWPERCLLHKGSDYIGKSDAVFRFGFENEMKTIIRLYPPFLALLVGGLKWSLYAGKFLLKNKLSTFISVSSELFSDLCRKKIKSRVSLNTVALVDDIRCGKLQKNLVMNSFDVANYIGENSSIFRALFPTSFFKKSKGSKVM